MAVQFGTFINDLAERAGMKSDDPKLKAFLTGLPPSIGEVPDEIANSISQNLFNIDSAKGNAQLKGYFHAQALSVPDKTVEELLDEYKFDDSVKAEFKNEKITPKKIKMLAEKIEAKNKALIEEIKKANGSEKSNERIDKLTGEITKLNNDLLAKDTEWSAKVKAAEQKAELDSLTFAQRMALATKPFPDPTNNENVEFADIVLQKDLLAAKAKPVLINGSLKLVQSDNPDLPYMENHKEVSFGDFSDRALAKRNMLKVSSPNKQENAPPIKPAEGKELIPETLRQSIASNYDKQIAILSNGVN